MQITRLHHLRYMTKWTPALIVLYLIQVYLYQKFAPINLASDINLLTGFGLALLILCYYFYDQHQHIIFHRNYLEIRFDLLKQKEEILYKNIQLIEIKKTNSHFGNVTLHHKDGNLYQLLHVDSPELIQRHLEELKSRH